MELLDELPEAIQWSEGMLLSPQHMQQNDIYWQRQFRHLFSLMQPDGWGVVDLAHDEAALAKQVIRITRLHAVTRDGLVVQYPARHEDVLELDLSQAEWDRFSVLRISLVVPVRDKGAAAPGSAIQRFDAIPGELECDETFPESRVEVGRLRPRLALFAGTVPPRYTALPLMEIVRDAGGNLRLGSYLPPCLRLGAADFLGEQHIMRRMPVLAAAMRAKIRDLAGGRRLEDNVARLDVEAKRSLFVAQHLAIAVPAFELTLGADVHPHALYVELGRMAGQLAALAANPTPPVLSAYRHEDARPGFDEMLAFLESRLNLVSPLFESMLFDRDSDERFSRFLPEGVDADHIVVELRPRKGQTAQSLVGWIAQATIGAEELIPLLEKRRLPGAARVAIEIGEVRGLNVSDGAALFRLSSAKVDQPDNQSVPLIQPGARLIIQGPKDRSGPIDIVLHNALAAGRVPRDA